MPKTPKRKKRNYAPQFPRDLNLAIGWMTGELGLTEVANVWKIQPAMATYRIAGLLKRSYQFGLLKKVL